MKKKRFGVEQIVGVLKQAEVGVPVVELIRKVGISEQTFYRWKAKYVGLEVDQVRQMKQLQEENLRLKHQITSVSVGSCPAAVAFDCHKRRMWVSSSCGTGNDPVWVFGADSMAEIGSAITPGGTITTPPVASNDDNLFVTAGGVSKEINGTTFAVTTTTFGTVMAIDSNTFKVFATSGNNMQVISAHDEAVTKTATLTYTPTAMGVNNAMAHVYLLNSAAGTIDVYAETAKKLATFTLPSGDQPSSIAVDSVRGLMFVDVFNSGTKAWSMLVIQDLSTVRLCGYSGSCDY